MIADHDPTCHGEIVAIRDDCKNIQTHDFSGCKLYTTLSTCPMCKGAILWANIDEVYYGCTTIDSENIGFRDEVFYSRWNDDNGHDYGKMQNREEYLELFEEYEKLEHTLY